jgi:drug/metabolite transporter (DMT)-like permease
MNPYLYAFGAIFLWGSTAAVIKLLLDGLNSLQILFFASLFAFCFLFVSSYFRSTLGQIRTFKIRDYIWFAGMGFLGVFVYYLGLYLAIDYLPAQEAFIINYLWPIFIVIFAIPILNEKFTFQKMLAIVLSFIGVTIVATNGNVTSLELASPLGVSLAVMSAASYALFSVLGKKSDYDRFLSMAFYYLFAFLYCSIAIFFMSTVPPISIFQIVGLVWIGVGTSGLAFTLWFLALKYGDTAKISNLAFLTPFLSLVYIYILLNEPILLSSLVGLAVIVAGILVQNFRLPGRQ